jgi:hypothetical protein
VFQKEQTSVVNKVYLPVNNLSLVSMTPAITFFPGVIDTGQKKPKSLKFITGVNDTTKILFSGVIDTPDKFFAGSTTPGIRQSCQYQLAYT